MGVTGQTRLLGARSERGQMTVELAVCIPAVIAVALVVFNAMLFMEHCAAFDRIAKEAVRLCAASPAHGQGPADSEALVRDFLRASFSEGYLDVDVESSSGVLGFAEYKAVLRFTPTLFGRSFSGAVFGVRIGQVSHEVSFTIDPYRPGVVV
ncbi:MAG: hypothetical protein IJ131_00530 [Eggerthellaceae bacterium]|nr:hypothetical protein [Eggerthellaceae bacterium]